MANQIVQQQQQAPAPMMMPAGLEFEYWGQIAAKNKVATDALMGYTANKVSIAKKGAPATPEEMIEFGALCLNAGLNPATNEVSPMVRGGHVSLIIGVDGWMTIANSNPDFDGVDWEYAPEMIATGIGNHKVPLYIDCIVYKKSTNHPFKWRTYFTEAFQPGSSVWKSSPNHMLQVRALSNAVKRCFGLHIYDTEEAKIIEANTAEPVEVQDITTTKVPAKKATAKKAMEAIGRKKASEVQQVIESAPVQAQPQPVEPPMQTLDEILRQEPDLPTDDNDQPPF